MLEDPKAVRIIKNLQICLWGNKFLFSGSLRKRYSGGPPPTALEHHYPVIPTMILSTKFFLLYCTFVTFYKAIYILTNQHYFSWILKKIMKLFWNLWWFLMEHILKWMFSRSLSNTFTLFRIKFIDPLQYINRLSVRGDL